ncbi:AraC family transcriptional regulator [Burkholderia pseudomallei]|uniref:AraC family transcriptional regulator n=1 Tax=Burkholderia pseudomallei TaxID=28450 RepID=UPI000F0D7A31|nr:AraC family transcriptional regulator [Burkholderia pseudomallei]VCN36513.1 AraC family transcriptional regulator [Burkholderia pseudomallei]VCN37365.1 AraC family transcriptional regulator [Burkholderia pseudomallei]
MIDRLKDLLARFELHARVFHFGALPGASTFEIGADGFHMHLVRTGAVNVTGEALGRHAVPEPGAVFIGRPGKYRIEARGDAPVEVLSAAIEFGLGDENPLLRGLPDLLAIPLASMSPLGGVQQALFAEASAPACGHDTVINRLTEMLVVQLLRFVMRNRLVASGSLAGLSDARLAKALNAMHADPALPWSLERMAAIAGMSRSRFAAHFAGTVGLPPGEYLLQWRVGLAKTLLRRGYAVKEIAPEVGYGSASALTRAFAQSTGQAPTDWLARAGDAPGAIGAAADSMPDVGVRAA